MFAKTFGTGPAPVDGGRPMRRRRAFAALALAVVLAQPATGALAETDPPSAPAPAASTWPASFADLAARVKPAVVNIATVGKRTRSGGHEFEGPRFPPGSPFEDYFRRFFEPRSQGRGHSSAPAEVRSLGSGFIIDADGLVVTNDHVIEGADEITVVLEDGSRHPATVRGRDAKTDLALLEIEAGRPLPTVSWGDSEAARVGDWVVAVGNPFGLGGTVTVGIVSARGRDIQSGPFDDFIQIDAPINRGNSGGPLFDTRGRVIGVNTAIYSPNGGSVGIGFAVPASLARPIIAELKEHGRVERGWLGVSIQPVTVDIADGLGLKEEKGALVAGIVPDGPAARAGLAQGDVILAVNGRPVERFKDLPRLVAAAKSGDSAEIAIWRQGVRRTVAVILGRMPGDGTRVAGVAEKADGLARSVGLALSSLSEEARRRYRLADDVRGVLVVGVDEGGAAARRGLRAGDVIVEANQAAVATPGDVAREIERAAAAKRNAILLLVNQRGNERFVAIPLKRA